MSRRGHGHFPASPLPLCLAVFPPGEQGTPGQVLRKLLTLCGGAASGDTPSLARVVRQEL